MFERYSEKARRIIFFARYEASQFGSPYIESEHMLLAILRESRETFLSSDDRAKLTQEITSQLPHNEKISTSIDLPLSHALKRSLAYAAEEAERVAHKNIDAAHLLLGLLRIESPVSAALNRYGITIESLRERLTQPISSQSAAPGTVSVLRSDFAPMLDRLTPEIEPATVFSLHPPSKDPPR